MQIFFGALTAIVLATTIHFYAAIAFSPQWLARLDSPSTHPSPPSWRVRIGYAYILIALIGSLAIVYMGTKGLLWWVPEDWGSRTEDGFIAFRDTLAGIVSMASIFPITKLYQTAKDAAR